MAYESSRVDSIKIRVWCLNRLWKNFSCYFLTEASTWLNAAYNTVFNISGKVFSLSCCTWFSLVVSLLRYTFLRMCFLFYSMTVSCSSLEQKCVPDKVKNTAAAQHVHIIQRKLHLEK